MSTCIHQRPSRTEAVVRYQDVLTGSTQVLRTWPSVQRAIMTGEVAVDLICALGGGRCRWRGNDVLRTWNER